MTRKAFAIYDTKAGVYNPPFFYSSIGEALRMFRSLVTAGDNLIAKYPGDFILFELGTFDPDTGALASITPHHLGVGSDFVELPQNVLPIGVEAPREVQDSVRAS